MDVPLAGVGTAHEEMEADFADVGGGGFIAPAKVVSIEPFGGFAVGLLDEGSHGQADHEAAGPGAAVGGVGMGDAVPEPGENDGGGFAEAGGDGDELRLAGERTGRSRSLQGAGEAALVGVGGVAGGGAKEDGKIGAHEFLQLTSDFVELTFCKYMANSGQCSISPQTPLPINNGLDGASLKHW